MFLLLFLVSDLEKDLKKDEVVEYIYNNYYGYIKYSFFKHLPECTETDDLIQDVFLSLMKDDISVDYKDDVALKKYLNIVCRNKSIDYVKKNQHILYMPSMQLKALNNKALTPEETAILNEEHNELYGIIMSLNSPEKEICSMKYLLHLKNKDIAKILGVSANAVALKLHKSKREIKVKYEKLKKRL